MESFKINTTNLQKISQFVAQVAIEAKPILQEIAETRLAETAAFLFDQLWDTQSHIDISALTKARTNIHIRQSQRDHTCYFGLGVSVATLSSRTSVVFFESPFFDAIRPIIEKVGSESNLKLQIVQNNLTGIVFNEELISNFLPKTSNVESYIPSFEARCNHAAHNGCFGKFLSEVSEHNQITTRALDDFKLWLDTEDGQSSFQAALNYCRENLKPTITNNDL
jgi:hypothetical protein